MSEINEIKEPTTEITETPTREELIKRYAEIQKITEKEANEQVGAPTAEEVLKNIETKTLEKIRSKQLPMNRSQRRALKKKVGARKYAEIVAESGDITAAVSETAQKINYINLIQELRELNNKENKNGNSIKDN